MTPLWLALAFSLALAVSVEAQPTETETTPSTDEGTAHAERELPDPRRRTPSATTDHELRALFRREDEATVRRLTIATRARPPG